MTSFTFLLLYFSLEAEAVNLLVGQLGSPHFAEREAATKALLKIGMPALEALRAAANDYDLEKSRRARLLLARQVRGELEKLQGTWVATEMETYGTRVVGKTTLTFEGAELRNQDGFRMFITVAAGSGPKEITLTYAPFREAELLGIYELEGDRLTLCFTRSGQPRPTRFSGAQAILYVFRREHSAPGRTR